MKTFQDWLTAKEKGQTIDFIRTAINEYKSSTDYKVALDADEYEAERNVTVMQYVKKLYTMSGQEAVDYTSSNNRIASNFFHRLTTQRVSYSLGNGVSFANATQEIVDGKTVIVDTTKDALGNDFDTALYDAGDYARIHKVSYLLWNFDHVDVFKMTEFLPLFDEYDGKLKAGFRFWSLDWDNKPVTVVVYEMDGYTKYRTKDGSKGLDIAEYEPKRAYKVTVAHNEVDPDEVIGESNYADGQSNSLLPIVPFWGSKSRQSDLVGMRAKIDAYDLIKSGFANDLMDCAEIYWIVSNAMGMNNDDLMKFRDRIKLQHIAVVDTENSPVTPYTQSIPVEARETLLKSLKEQLYNDYGALDVTSISGGESRTATEIEAAYQPMDDEADDFEYQVIKAVRGILNIIGIDDMPIFSRNRISNQKEQTDMIISAANYLDDATVLKKLPWITTDEVETILAQRDATIDSRINLEE